MQTTLANLFDFIDHLGATGKINPKVAAQLSSSVRQVALTESERDWSEIDLAQGFDMEAFLQRFRELRKDEYAPISLAEYQRRFRRAVTMFLDYAKAEDKENWVPNLRPGRPRATNVGRARARLNMMLGSLAMNEFDNTTQSNMIVYPFPLRQSVFARLILPSDLKPAEVERLVAFLRSLAVDYGSGAANAESLPTAQSTAEPQNRLPTLTAS
ncbi:MAG: hypothetical protein RMM31_10150 [Anaerolineae bacterium]|nr:hypothetical protein [Thermoflexales bacterium]MDW8396589.1 hypothetical protein [Anaerolineae bacterium]